MIIIVNKKKSQDTNILRAKIIEHANDNPNKTNKSSQTGMKKATGDI